MGAWPTLYVWLTYDPFETSIAARIPASVRAVIGVTADRRLVPRAAWCTLAVLAIADVSGRNMEKVAPSSCFRCSWRRTSA